MVVAAYNVPALGDVPLVLNLSVIADIYLGNVVWWNDSKIVELNPELVGLLPSTEIMVLVLNEPSEITRLFTGALAKAVPGWNDAVRREGMHNSGGSLRQRATDQCFSMCTRSVWAIWLRSR
jgi:phosphate transport system substrate-binding protein